MKCFRRHYRFNQIAILAIALLVSNIATMSCAMAFALCGDCPEHEPVLCVDSCATADAAISDQSSDSKATTYRPFALSTGVLVACSELNRDFSPVTYRQSPDPQTSAPLHRHLCILLK